MWTPYGKTKSDDDRLQELLDSGYEIPVYWSRSGMRHIYNVFVISEEHCLPPRNLNDSTLKIYLTEEAATKDINLGMPDLSDDLKIRPAQLIWED